MELTEKKALIHNYQSLQEQLKKTLAELYPDNEQIDELKVQVKICSDEIAGLNDTIAAKNKLLNDTNASISFYSKNDKVKEMLDYVNSGFLVFTGYEEELYDCEEGAIYQVSKNNIQIYSFNKESELIEKSKINPEYKLVLDNVLKNHYNKIKNMTSVSIIKTLKYYNKLVNSSRKYLKTSPSVYFFNSNTDDISSTGEADKIFLVAKKNIITNEGYLKSAGKYDEKTAAELLVELKKLGYSIVDSAILQTAENYVLLLKLKQQLVLLENKFADNKIKIPGKKKKNTPKVNKVRTAQQQVQYLGSENNEKDLFEYAAEINELVVSSVAELRTLYATTAEERNKLSEDISKSAGTTDYHGLTETEKGAVSTIYQRLEVLIATGPDRVISQLLALSQEVYKLCSDAGALQYNGNGLAKLSSLMQSKIPTLEGTIRYAEHLSEQYTEHYNNVLANGDEIVALLNRFVKKVSEFSAFNAKKRTSFFETAVKYRTDQGIAEKLWDLLRNHKFELLFSFGELLLLTTTGKFDFDKAQSVADELESIEKELFSVVAGCLANKKLSLTNIEEETDKVFADFYAQMSEKLQTIKYDL